MTLENTGLGQVQKCGMAKPDNRIPTLSLLIIIGFQPSLSW